MKDLKVELQELKEESDSGALESPGVVKPRRRQLIWAVGLATGLVMVATGVWLVRSRSGKPEPQLGAGPLTSYPGTENSPSFSPDGTQVVFQRCPKGREKNCDIYVKQIGVEPPSRLTNTQLREFSPAWSPDGRTLVFARMIDDFRSNLCFLNLDDDHRPKGEPKMVLDNPSSFGMAWMPDGKEIVFFTGSDLCRMLASKSATPRRLALVSGNVSAPAISRQGNRLAYVEGTFDTNIWRIELKGAGLRPSAPAQLISSTQAEWTPACSPDGGRIAFGSNWSGGPEIWACDSDGSNPAQLASFGGIAVPVSDPVWSPDSQKISFTAGIERLYGVYVVSANGGVPRRITPETSSGGAPCWSRDGQSI
jgi:Tol biopolymer transport system component